MYLISSQVVFKLTYDCNFTRMCSKDLSNQNCEIRGPESRDLQVALRWNSWRHNQGHDNALFVIERRCINSSFFNRLLCHCNTLTALESSKFIMLKGKNVGGFTLTVNFICPLVLIFTEKALLFLNFTPSNSLLTENISLMKKMSLSDLRCPCH